MRILFILVILVNLLFGLEKVSIQLDWKYQFEFAGYIAAKEKGFYKKAGLDVDLVELHHNDIVKEVLNGKYTFGIFDNNLLIEELKKHNIKLIASIFKRSAYVLIVDPNIENLKQLEHKTLMIAITSIDIFKNFLSSNGVDTKTIKFVPTTYSVEPFVKHKIVGFSAFITDEPYILDQKGVKFYIINPSDYGYLMYQGELFTRESFAKNHPILVNKFKQATIKGWEYALSHKKELVDIIYNKYSKRKSKKALLDEANRLETIIQKHIYPIGFIDKNVLKAQFEQYINKMNLNTNVNKVVDEFVFSFKNPLHLSKKYLVLIKFYNFYIENKTNFIISFIFIIIILIVLTLYFKLKRQKDEIYTLFNKAPVAYVLMDFETRIILNVNDYGCILFETTKEYLLGRTSREFYFSDDDFYNFKIEAEKYIKKFGSIEGFSSNWKFKTHKNKPFWANLKAVIYNKKNILWILTDITDFIEAQDKLKTAMKVKDDFLANMSHEIRTPLNAILGFVDIIYEKESDKENKKFLSIVKKSGKSLLTIINDILDFSKIESGKLKIEKIQFNPKDEFETLISLFESKSNEKHITLKICFSNLQHCIVSDPTRIKQVISNLVSNAIKFTPENKTIICNINYDSKKEKLYVEVIDEGIGISQDKLKHIFEAFSQADTSTTRKYGGTGLGLTISKNLVQLLGGDLSVESKMGEGSRFYFSIPAHKTELIKNKKEIQETNIKMNFDAKVLIVEDNKANQMFFQVILKTLGIKNIEIANDGIEGLQKANDEFDIIFMDENMPNMNGLESAKKIKEKGVKTPIITVTANALSGDKEKFLEVMDDYLSKPIEKDKLIEVLNKYLKENR